MNPNAIICATVLVLPTKDTCTVVLAPSPPAPKGWWLVKEASLPAVVYKKSVSPADMDGTLGSLDMQVDHWEIDDAYCWCETCAASRKFLETQTD